MSRRPALPLGELLLIVGLGAGVLLIGLLPVPSWIKTTVFVPFVLIVPGCVAALFLPPRFGRQEAIVYIVALSIAVTALVGLIVQVFLPLDRATWAVALVSTTTVAYLLARTKRPSGSRATREPRTRSRWPRVNPLPIAAFLAATAIAGGAIFIATEGAHDQRDRSRFASLWLVPGDGAAGTERGTVTLGVANHGGGDSTYELRLSRGSKPIDDWLLALGPEDEWTTSVESSTVAGSGPLVASLYRNGKLYRQVALKAGGAT